MAVYRECQGSGFQVPSMAISVQPSAFAILRSQSKHLVASRTIIVYPSNKMLRSGSAKCDLAARTFTHSFKQAHPDTSSPIQRKNLAGEGFETVGGRIINEVYLEVLDSNIYVLLDSGLAVFQVAEDVLAPKLVSGLRAGLDIAR